MGQGLGREFPLVIAEALPSFWERLTDTGEWLRPRVIIVPLPLGVGPSLVDLSYTLG